jgi:DNA-binding LytR/AlgR family response regulator
MQLIDKNGKLTEVDLKKVLHIERDTKNNKTFFYTAQTVYHYPSSLKEIESAYMEHGFQRISKNSLINLDRVDKREKGFLFIGSRKYPVTRRNEDIIKRILSHM